MNRTEFYTGITNTYKEAYEIIKKKTNDYASEEHPLHNLELIERLTESIDRNAGIFVRMTDKFSRLGNLLFAKDDKEIQVSDESIDDTTVNLRKLNLGHNQVDKLPSSLINWTKLQELQVNQNKLKILFSAGRKR